LREHQFVISADPAACPYVIHRPVMMQRWATLSFLHWSFDPPTVQRLLPPSLTAETFDDRAWVGLVPFFMHVWLPHTRPVPWVSRFCETNVRTYVRDESGRVGIWFFSLDAARLGAVLTARTTYRLPYFWSQMRLTRSDSSIAYSCRRRWPDAGAGSNVVVDIGAPFAPSELSARDHFLTARWLLFSVAGERHRFARAAHEIWPLRRATVRECHDELLMAAGLPANNDPPLAHYSDGVDVRIGRPERVA
jgi:uncharacterized protein YqjF (DUF2071 family)